MFDIGFSKLLLVLVIGLVVLGPQRLPVVVKTVIGWIRAVRALVTNAQNELVQEMKLQELQERIKKVEQVSKESIISSELTASVEELKQAGELLQSGHLYDSEKEIPNPANFHDASAGTKSGKPFADVTSEDTDNQAVTAPGDIAIKQEQSPDRVAIKEVISSGSPAPAPVSDER